MFSCAVTVLTEKDLEKPDVIAGDMIVAIAWKLNVNWYFTGQDHLNQHLQKDRYCKLIFVSFLPLFINAKIDIFR